MPKSSETQLAFRHISLDFAISDLDDAAWKKADGIEIERYWNGQPAPNGRRATAMLLWSDTALYVRFEAHQDEPLVVSDKPELRTKTLGLWDRDVCEIFVAPDIDNPHKYFEFEIAPNGEWLDIGIDRSGNKPITDWDYTSGMQSATSIETSRVILALKIEWKAFGKTPKAGDIWLGNLLRCVGKDPDRGYLAWQPTMTDEPNFHVPEKFGRFKFLR